MIEIFGTTVLLGPSLVIGRFEVSARALWDAALHRSWLGGVCGRGQFICSRVPPVRWHDT